MNEKNLTGSELLRFLREKRGLTLRDLQDLSRIPNSDLSRMERGSKAIGATRALRLAQVFEVDYQRLMTV